MHAHAREQGVHEPEDLCLVDFKGNQLLGAKRLTSEILMHLQIMQRQPRAVATVHCHPPHATGFAVAGMVPRTRLIPEYELFISAALAPYRTPGTPELGRQIARLVDKHNVVLMANHGVVSWSHNNVEDACFKMEILESYCRTVLIASQLSRSRTPFRPRNFTTCSRSRKASASPTRVTAASNPNVRR